MINLNSFVLGLLVAVVFFVVAFGALYVGYRFGSNGKHSVDPDEDEEQEIKRLEELQRGFVKLMNYDVTTAMQRKKV